MPNVLSITVSRCLIQWAIRELVPYPEHQVIEVYVLLEASLNLDAPCRILERDWKDCELSLWRTRAKADRYLPGAS